VLQDRHPVRPDCGIPSLEFEIRKAVSINFHGLYFIENEVAALDVRHPKIGELLSGSFAFDFCSPTSPIRLRRSRLIGPNSKLWGSQAFLKYLAQQVPCIPSSVPLLAPLLQDPLQQFFGGFAVGVSFAPGLGELAGDGGGEDGLAVAFQLGFGLAQGGDADVEPRKKFLNPRHDAAWFGKGRIRHRELDERLPGEIFDGASGEPFLQLASACRPFQEID
jgi:hypothetical protein